MRLKDIKLRWLTLVLIAATFSTAQAQYEAFSFGIKAGLNFSNVYGPSETLNGSDLESGKLVFGYHLGPVFSFRLNDKFGFQTEVLYSQKGGKYRYSGSSFGIDSLAFLVTGNRNQVINDILHYIEIPLSGYFHITDNLRISLGAYGGFLLSANGTGSDNFVIDGTNEVIRTDLDYDLDGGFFNRFDVGVLGGVDFVFDSGLKFGFRASSSLNDLTKNDFDFSKSEINIDPTNGTASLVNREDVDRILSLQFSVGFGF